MSTSRLLSLGVVLVFIGFLVLVVASLSGSSSASSGGFILIGPIPIVFGRGPSSGMLALVGLAITVAMIVLYLVMLLVWRSGRHLEAEA